MAVRPEDLDIIISHSADTPAGVLNGVVEAALFVGERVEYQIQVEQQQRIIAYGDRHTAAGPGICCLAKAFALRVTAYGSQTPDSVIPPAHRFPAPGGAP